jgi:hypothetical protein
MNSTDWEAVLRSYYETLDASLDQLAHMQEARLHSLPGFAVATRDIEIGITTDGSGVLIKVTPREDLSLDKVSHRQLRTSEDVADLVSPFELTFDPPGAASISGFVDGAPPSKRASNVMTPDQLGGWPFSMVGEVTLFSSNPLTPPLLAPSPYFGFGRADEARRVFSTRAAKEKAIELWNEALSGTSPKRSRSFVQSTRSVFSKFSAILKRKSFLERRIHRYINEHKGLLLPPFVRCFFEHRLRFNDEERKADFILERQPGFPALLIELESPSHRVLRKDGHLTAASAHAVGQVADWVRIIDSDAKHNASGELSFLAGPKDRLIVIGRGVEHREALLNSRFSGTTLWTYDLLWEQARTRWNNILSDQCRLLGLPEAAPF